VNTLRRAALAPAREVAHGPRPELVLDRFRLLEPLGSGGHGTVWAARDERLRRVVALKRIPRGHGSSAADRRRIDREALAAARLAHPAIVSFYEALSDEDAYYLVSELVEGSSLAQRYARNRPDEGELVAIGAALADALAHAHARGVVHRDVKPQNVIVAADPVATGARAKLTDFGVALIAGELDGIELPKPAFRHRDGGKTCADCSCSRGQNSVSVDPVNQVVLCHFPTSGGEHKLS